MRDNNSHDQDEGLEAPPQLVSALKRHPRRADIPVRSKFRKAMCPGQFLSRFTHRTMLRTGMSARRLGGRFAIHPFGLWLLCLSLPLCLAAIVLLPGCAMKKPMASTALPGARAMGFSGPLTAGLRRGASSSLAALPASSEELWILARGGDGPVTPSNEAPGPGALMAKVEEKQVPLPLTHTDVRASISGYIGAVEVTQQFLNPYSSGSSPAC